MKKILPFFIITLFAVYSVNSIAKKEHPHEGKLPPGLQKKADRGEALPPGWQKKLNKGDIIEESIYEHAVILSPPNSLGEIKIKIEDELFRVHEKTRKIVDILF